MSEFRFFAFTDFEYHTNRSQNLLNLPFTPFRPTTTTDDISHELNIPYTVFEILVAIFAIVGNLMVIIVFQRERKLRRRTNYYIVSLAMADFLVGSLGVPFAIMASIGMPENLYACLFTVSLLVVLCTISIFCLVAVSVDRYWAILYPMAYSRNVRTRTAIVIISMCWLAGAVVGFLPLFGWHADVGPNQACLFVEVMDYNYLVFLYFATIITPALIMLAFYMHIYRVIVKQVRQIVTMNPVSDTSRRSSTSQIQFASPGRGCHGGTMLRVLGAARKRDVKATQNLSIIVLFFMICWIPLYTINCIKAFCPNCDVHPKLTLFCIILSHLNSAVNPVLYAYHLKDFRAALKNLILKVMGIEVEPHMEAIHRFSVASQHRLQSMDATMRQPRIYVDSPIWLRQQQQILKNQIPKCGVVSPCIGNSIGSIHQTVAAVASVPTDIERDMWNIMEASSGAEMADMHYEFPDDDNNETVTPCSPKRQFRNHRLSSTKREGYDSPYSYNNHNYSTSPEESNDVEYDDVFLPSIAKSDNAYDANHRNSSLIACAMRQKLQEDDGDYQQRQHMAQRSLTDSSYSDYEIPKHATAHERRRSSCTSKRKNSPAQESNNYLVTAHKVPSLARSESLSPTTSNTCLAANASTVFVIDGLDATNRSSGQYAMLKRATHLSRAKRDFNRTCASDSSSPSREQQANTAKLLANNSSSSDSNSSTQSVGLLGNHKNSNNNNSHTSNNLNYYTVHQHPINPQFIRNRSHPEKFSPLKAMSNFIFPPIVKHSSLFQLFQPSNTTSSNTNSSATKATHMLSPQLANNLVADESRSTSVTDVITDEHEATTITAANS